ncbi:MAG: peptide chain release factor N(5)-glutamine methyltransferase [Bryobacterales bacterium]|nr:peptide chain release factor N(5)-glutamine methyltransferase [Bryobacterales bacterium]
MTIQEALSQGTRLLDDERIVAPRLTAEVLLCHALHCERVYLYAHSEEPLTELAWIHYGRYLKERIDGKPTQYITQQQEFYGRAFFVSPDVLIPRPETEHLVEAALKYGRNSRMAIDVGCGSGAIAVTLALELKHARVFASDISPGAVKVARRNAETHGAKVRFLDGDLLAPVRDGSMDLVASNPPYVPRTDEPSLQREVRDFEPEVALYGGPTGNEMYGRLIPEALRVLKPGGWLIMELGYRSLKPVRRLLHSEWRAVQAIDDLGGIPRVLVAQKVP